MLPYDDDEGRRRDRTRFLALWIAGISGGASGGMLGRGTPVVLFSGALPPPSDIVLGAVVGVVLGLLATAFAGMILAMRRSPDREAASWGDVLAVAGLSALAGAVPGFLPSWVAALSSR